MSRRTVTLLGWLGVGEATLVLALMPHVGFQVAGVVALGLNAASLVRPQPQARPGHTNKYVPAGHPYR